MRAQNDIVGRVIMSSGPDLRERTRRILVGEIADQAMALFAERGFEATTVNDIAAAAGISPRSFFRYFPTKEDVVMSGAERLGETVRDLLVARPETESPWEALVRALRPFIEGCLANPERTRRDFRVMRNTPSLRARHLEKQMYWEGLLVPELTRRIGIPPRARIEARSMVSAALVCLDVAIDRWTEPDCAESLDELLAIALGALKK